MDNPSQISREERDLRTWGAATHLSALAGLFIPLGNVLAPLVIWLIKRHDAPILDRHGVAALNFQLSMSIYIIVAALLTLVLIGIILLPILVVVDIVYVVIATVRASDGQVYDYPLTIPFIR